MPSSPSPIIPPGSVSTPDSPSPVLDAGSSAPAAPGSITPAPSGSVSAPGSVVGIPEATPDAPAAIVPLPTGAPSAPGSVTPAPSGSATAPGAIVGLPDATPDAPAAIVEVASGTPAPPDAASPAPIERIYPVGPPGLSAYQVAVANGYVGTEAEWLESLVGDGAATIFLTGEQPLPTAPEEFITLTGGIYDTEPQMDITYQPIADINGYPAWSADGSNPFAMGTDGIFVDSFGNTLIRYYGQVYTATAALQPEDYATAEWTGLAEGDTPGAWSFTIDAIESSAPGQMARWGDAPPYRWFVALAAATYGLWVEIVRRDGDGGKPTAIDLENGTNLPPAGIAGNIPVSKGGTGAATAREAVTNLTNIVNNANTTINLSTTNSGTILRCTAATAVTINVSGELGANFNVLVIQAGAGQITFVAAGGAAVNSFGALMKTAGQHASAALIRVASSTYNLSGNLA